MSSSRWVLFVALLLCVAMAGGSQSGCLEPAERDPDARGSDAVPAEYDWPPEVGTADDSEEIGPAGGKLELLGGEVVLDVPAGAVKDAGSIQVTRRLVSAGGTELVGYIWGPHNVKIEPAARIEVRADAGHVPPWVSDTRDAQLYAVDGDVLSRLSNQAPAEAEGQRVLLVADLAELGTVVIGPLP